MSPLRYKTLLTFLPGMASVVNAFDSPQVQGIVYEMLMEALDIKLQAEGVGRTLPSGSHTSLASVASNGELMHDLIEGESIHAAQSRAQSRSSTTVF